MSDTLKCTNTDFVRQVEERSGATVSSCLQCHKCSTGCPVAPEMGLLSSQVMRLIILGEEDELLKSPSIWLCASCEACTTRCPMDIDIAAVMDALRMMAIEKKLAPADVNGKHFNKAFLNSVRKNGRVHEVGMMTSYKFASKDFFADVDKAPKMFLKGKLALFPKGSKDAGKVKEVFKRAEEEEKNR